MVFHETLGKYAKKCCIFPDKHSIDTGQNVIRICHQLVKGRLCISHRGDAEDLEKIPLSVFHGSNKIG
jgi:hypothetical protein